MANEKKVPEIDEKAKAGIKKSQATSKSKSQQDLVDIEITADGSFYKKGQKDRVHPTVAAILKEKGMIK